MNRLAVALVITFSAFAQRAANPARLVFCRDTNYNGTAIHASIKIDSDKVTHKLRNDQYWATEVSAGDHFIFGDERESGKTYTIEAGKTYYFQVQSSYPEGFRAAIFGGKLRFLVIPVTTDIAKVEMTGLKPDVAK